MLTNTYPGRIGKGKALFENLRYHLRKTRLYFQNGFKHKSVLFYPDMPSKKAVLTKVVRSLNYNITNNPSQPYQLAINWEDATYKKDVGRTINCAVKLNFNCLDISKVSVDQAFATVFGYSTFVNPLVHEGKMVQKSDENARHDGIILNGPIQENEVSSDHIYQLLIDNTDGTDRVKDFRAPVFKGRVPFVYIKFRPIDDRFSNTNTFTQMVGVREAFTEEEEQLIGSFCDLLQLDYGELDILRDNSSGKLYIVDVNNTPWGPPNHLSKDDANKALSLLSDTFSSTFLKA